MLHRSLLSTLLIVGLAAGCSSSPAQPDEQPVETAEEAEAKTERAEGAETAEKDATFAERLHLYADGPHRDEGNALRNQYRNPVETLMFFGLQPDMTVVELGPGRGWYTEILAPALAEEGKLVLAYGDAEHLEGYVVDIINSFDAKLLAHPDIYGATQRAYLHAGHRIELGEPGSADMVLTFRSMHGWHSRNQIEEIVPTLHKVLRPGGILGIVQHRAPEGADPDETAKAGYLPQAYVVATIEAYGFELVEASEINANPADTADHPEGVWTLPPNLRLEDTDREKYVAIGESDRMTLKFKKVEAKKAVDDTVATDE
ncbi:MAG: class I SAM-dependent methyltransferase [Bradymonadaceae bacterium]